MEQISGKSLLFLNENTVGWHHAYRHNCHLLFIEFIVSAQCARRGQTFATSVPAELGGKHE